MTSSEYPTDAIPVAPGAYAYIQPGGATNAGFLVHDDGILVIDSLMTPALATRLLAAVRRESAAPIRYVINTHWHGDHTFGNRYFLPAPIVGHTTCREDLIARWDDTHRFLISLYPHIEPELAEVVMAAPDLTFPDRLSLHAGGDPVELAFFGPAHTRGDIVVHLPRHGVVYAGDIAFHQYFPNARDGYVTSWVHVAQQVERLDAETVVPGHGPVGTTRDLRDMRECLEHLVGEIRRAYDRGLDAEQASREVSLGRFADWGRKEDRVPGIVRRLYQEFQGKLA